MLDWLKPLPLLFYAPTRALGLVRDRAPLGFAALLALVAQVVNELYVQWPYLAGRMGALGALTLFALLRDAVGSLFVLGFALVPALVLCLNWFDRRGSFRLVMQQEFAPLAAAIGYVWAAAHLTAWPLFALARWSGLEAAQIAQTQQTWAVLGPRWQFMSPELLAQSLAPQRLSEGLAFMFVVPFVLVWTLVAVRAVFRVPWGRALSVLAGGGVLMVVAWPLLKVLGTLLASPFLLVLLFLGARSYIGEALRTQRARASFRQNLEAATLNPADASAHYNLGLIHLQRKELTAARERFRRAVEIDTEEVDAHYQLGRISRMEHQLPAAIEHFGQVVTRAPQHAQHEVWREIGATYLAAGQDADALAALDQFLEQRPSDPEALYLRGRALAALGRRREAAEAMRACIESVRTAPAYKYRADKRWLNEAQQFLRSQA